MTQWWNFFWPFENPSSLENCRFEYENYRSDEQAYLTDTQAESKIVLTLVWEVEEALLIPQELLGAINDTAMDRYWLKFFLSEDD